HLRGVGGGGGEGRGPGDGGAGERGENGEGEGGERAAGHRGVLASVPRPRGREGHLPPRPQGGGGELPPVRRAPAAGLDPVGGEGRARCGRGTGGGPAGRAPAVAPSAKTSRRSGFAGAPPPARAGGSVSTRYCAGAAGGAGAAVAGRGRWAEAPKTARRAPK